MAITFGSEYPFNEADTRSISSCLLDSTHMVVTFKDAGDSDKGKAMIGVISGDTIAWGAEYIFNNGSTDSPGVCKIDSTHFAIAYRNDADVSGDGYCVIGTVSNDDEINTWGTAYKFRTGGTSSITTSLLDSTHIVISYRGASNYATAIIGVISSVNQIAYGSEYAANASSSSYIVNSTLDSTHFVLGYTVGNHGYAIIGTVSNGDDIAYGTEVEFNNAETYYVATTKIDSTHFAIGFLEYGAIDGVCIIGTVASGNVITYGSQYIFDTAASSQIGVGLLDSTHLVVTYRDEGNTNKGTAIIGTIANEDEITYGDPVIFNDAPILYTSCFGITSTTFAVSFADNQGVTGYGITMIGTNPPPVVAPTITTQAVSSIAQTTATGNGNITATGGANCTRRGFCYKVGTSGDPTVADSTAYDDGDFGTGAFTKSITGLSAGTSYRVRAYAINSAGTGYGDTVQVTTLTAGDFFNFF
jgi:hypothetical protein